MKVVLVIDHIATGGAERILVDYYRHLVACGHSVVVFVLNGHDGQSEWTDGMNVIYGSSTDRSNLLVKLFQLLRLLVRLRHLLKHRRPDAVFSFLDKSNLLASLAGTGTIKILTVHNVISIQYQKIRSRFVRKVLYSVIRRMYNACTNVVAVSKQVKDDLVNSFGVNDNNIKVINNYVDRDDVRWKAAEPITDFSFAPGIRYVMSIGRFSDQKAQWKLIKAFSIYVNGNSSDVHLVLMGTGEHEVAMRQLVADLKISDKVTILPFNKNPYKYMSHADLFVLSSVFEGFPIVLAEVSSLGIPFIGSYKAIPEEMFADKDVWKECTYVTSVPERDFSVKIHDDEKELAVLIRRGIEDNRFRMLMARSTSGWECRNMKKIQFDCYDSLLVHKLNTASACGKL